MIIRIKKEVFTTFNPQIQIGFILATNTDNNSKAKESRHLLQEAEHFIRLSFNKETIRNHYLLAPWTIAQQEFGSQAKHYHTSVERLLQAVLHEKSVSAPDTLTNITRYLALRNIVPLAVDDMDKITGNITFALSSKKEKIHLLRSMNEKELYYHDEDSILGTKLDYWKTRKTRLLPSSNSALLHIEALPPITAKKLKEILYEAESLIQNFCGGKTKVFVLNKKKSSITV